MPARTHYQVLGVEHSATAEQIQRAYRALAKKHHPDVSREPGAQEQFARIARAYEVLSDRRLRAEYDLSLRSPNGAADKPRRRAERPGAAHYTWTNIATEQAAGRPPRATDFDEMYETFFKPHAPAE